jgi:histone H1-like protein Hc1
MTTEVGNDSVIVEKWNTLKTTIAEIELDVAKNARGNAAAGVRARKGLRLLARGASDLVRTTVTLDKAKKASGDTAEA